MLWFIPALFVVVLIFRAMLFGDMPPESILGWLGFTLFSAVFSLIPLGIAAGCAALTGLAFDTHPEKVSTDHLVAIRDKDGVVGNFFLGSGMIRGDQYYFYYRKNKDGSVTPDKVYAGQGVRVYEEDRADATLDTYEWKLNKPWAWWVSISVNNGGWSYKFYVPKGTVRTGYTM